MSKTVKHKTADTPPSRRMPNRDVRPFFEKLAATIDEPVTELNYGSNFELLIAVILSAQATDVSVNIATQQLYPVASNTVFEWVLSICSILQSFGVLVLKIAELCLF
jgi:endonuclease-3